MPDSLQNYLWACWEMLLAVAPYIGLGFLFVGMIHIFVTPNTIMKYLGRGRRASVIYAALPGIPLFGDVGQGPGWPGLGAASALVQRGMCQGIAGDDLQNHLETL